MAYVIFYLFFILTILNCSGGNNTQPTPDIKGGYRYDPSSEQPPVPTFETTNTQQWAPRSSDSYVQQHTLYDNILPQQSRESDANDNTSRTGGQDDRQPAPLASGHGISPILAYLQ